MQETRHDASQARYLYGTPQGVLEFRALPTATTTINTLIVHTAACDGDQCAQYDYDCDAESADDIALYWPAGDDAGIWYRLAEYAAAREVAVIDQAEHEPTHEQRALRGRLLTEGRRLTTDPDYLD